MTPILILLYARAALAWTKKKRSLRNKKLKENRALKTEEQGKEKLRNISEKDQEGEPKSTRGK